MRRLLLPLVSAALVWTPPAHAQTSSDAPVPIEEWSQERVSTLGRRIYLHDRAAWLATEALRETLTADEIDQVEGWIVTEAADGLRVRFAREADGVLVPGWDVPVGDSAGPVSAVETGSLFSATELAQFAARQTAAREIGALRCSREMNSVVFEDPDGGGWLVWLLAASTERGVIPVGGHYRFRVSADGSTLLRRDQLSNGCLNMRDDRRGPNGQRAGLVVTHIVSDGPVETHVFLSLLNRTPVYVAADDKLIAVEGDRIRFVQTLED
ncbi:hypothetical protein [Brevundimonas balnearis]|uniref:Uncharacterized protein n=1 Tax=Brevundimonas balnearis TaxID=1572858 RepID=A0ABV6R2I8_9CAUL